jgi:hypothetical protein
LYFTIRMNDCGYVCVEKFDSKVDLLANLANLADEANNDDWELDILESEEFERDRCVEIAYEDDRESIVIIKGDVINGDVTKRTRVKLTG